MRFLFIWVLLLSGLFLNCPKQVVPKFGKIEVIYLSSLYEDMKHDEPMLAGLNHLAGVKIGYFSTERPFMAVVLGRFGFYQLLNMAGLDYMISEELLPSADSINYFCIPKSMGYVIKNYGGIRFAILSKDKDSLTIDDEIKLSLVKQRSDVLWVLDKTFLEQPPMKVEFLIKNRELSDTIITAIKTKPDTVFLIKLHNFKEVVETFLNKKIYFPGKRFDEFILSEIAQHEDVNVILYPEDLFQDFVTEDSVTLEEIINNIRCEIKFRKIEISKEKLMEISKSEEYRLWGKALKKNLALLPVANIEVDNTAKYIFDLFYHGGNNAP